jgi:hypothetical protein
MEKLKLPQVYHLLKKILVFLETELQTFYCTALFEI